jgi:hypothetical protein
MRHLLLSLPLLAAACGESKPAVPTPPAHAEAVAHEGELLKLTLTPRAQQRLAIRTTRVGDGTAVDRRETSGEVVVPNAAGGVPTGSLSNLAQIGQQQAAADGEVARTRAQVRLARIALDRASALVREEAGSVRARDEAAAALATAEAQAGAAVAQRRLLGPAVASLGNQPVVWVRVPVFGTDVAEVARNAAAEVRPLGGEGAPRAARPVQAPPSSNAVAGTVDLYYALDNRDRAYRIGQRVAVALPLGGGGSAGRQSGLTVPISAIVRDMYGGEWVYQKTAPDTYLRRRIEVASTEGDRAILSRGLSRGDEIVTVGAMELFGTEFGVAH